MCLETFASRYFPNGLCYIIHDFFFCWNFYYTALSADVKTFQKIYVWYEMILISHVRKKKMPMSQPVTKYRQRHFHENHTLN